MDSTLSAVHEFLKNDPVTTRMGMEVVSIGEGRSELHMRVREDMLNGFAITHGGMVFTLADSALALASNDVTKETTIVAQHCEIDFTRPTKEGDTLVAKATVRHQGKRSGIYDVEVTNQQGKLVAVFRGRVQALTPRVSLPNHHIAVDEIAADSVDVLVHPSVHPGVKED